MPQAYKHSDKEVIVHCFVMLIKIGPHFEKKNRLIPVIIKMFFILQTL